MAEEGDPGLHSPILADPSTHPTEQGEEGPDLSISLPSPDIMCGACGQILRRGAHEYCVRCGVRLDRPERVWDARLCGNSAHDTPRIARVREEMLGRMVRVSIEDGRIFVGRFLAFDKHRSMILSECREYRRVRALDHAPEKEEKRNAGLILIGGKYIKRVHWAKLTEEGKQKLEEEEEERRRAVEQRTQEDELL